MVDELAGERHGGIDADRDITIKGEGHKVVGGDLIEAETYIANTTIQQTEQLAPLGLLPPDVAEFTGREAELKRLETELLAAHERAVVISAVAGKPGVGKSALAVHVAHRLAIQFPDGQVYVNLRGADQQPLSAETALTDLLHVLGLPGEQQPISLDGKAAVWRQRLAGKRVLVVIDNARDEAQVRPLLPGSSNCAVIVTSRQVLATLGGKPMLLDILDTDEALELVAKLAGSQRIAAEPPAALAAVAVCGGLPLALRIAGAKLVERPDWAVATLAERLADEHRRLVELGVRDLDVRASFQLSYQELPEEQTKAFRLLALWPGADFFPWVLSALVGDDHRKPAHEDMERLLDGLIRAQLVEPSSGSDRFRVHDLLRLFAKERLEVEEPDHVRVAANDRLLESSVSMVAGCSSALRQGPQDDQRKGVDRQTALAWLEAEREALVALIDDTIANHSWSVVCQLTEHLVGFLLLRGYWSDAERICRSALFAAEQSEDDVVQGRALHNLSTVLATEGKWAEAAERLRQSLGLHRSLGDRDGEATALTGLGTVYQLEGYWDEAADCYRKSLAIIRALGDRHSEAVTLNNLGILHDLQGRLPDAIDHCRQALDIYRLLDDQHGQGQALTNIGIALSRQEQWAEATDCYEESLRICRTLGDRHGEAQNLVNLGAALAEQEYWQEAVEYHQRGLRILRDLGDHKGEAESLGTFGDALAMHGRWDEAIGCYRDSLKARRRLNDLRGEGRTLILLASALVQEAELSEAFDCCQQSLRIWQELQDHEGEVQSLGMLGDLLGRRGRWEEATDHYQQAMMACRASEDRYGEGLVLTSLGVAFAAQNRDEEAIECWHASLRTLEELGVPEAEAVRQLLLDHS